MINEIRKESCIPHYQEQSCKDQDNSDYNSVAAEVMSVSATLVISVVISCFHICKFRNFLN